MARYADAHSHDQTRRSVNYKRPSSNGRTPDLYPGTAADCGKMVGSIPPGRTMTMTQYNEDFHRNTLVRRCKSYKSSGHQMDKNSTFIYMGDIIDMPGHGIFIGVQDHLTWAGFHTDDFEQVPEEDM